VTVSVPFQNELIARGVQRDRIEILHNAIRPDWGRSDPAQAAATREQWRIPQGRKVILIVGRLSREKDHITLLRAVHQLDSPELHVVLVGEGPERGAIEAELQALRMADRVTLTGQQKSAEPFYGIADIAVLSSLSEGSPNALLEAMAAGVPAVATRVGGIPEIVTHGESALLVEPSDITAMTGALRSLLQSPDLAQRLVQRSHQLIHQHHTPEERVRKLLGIYRTVHENA
jgi:glycosyltransferase involved in cell wall biosynthesis